MKFRPCIDIHNGSVKQIVGGSLKDQGNYAKENFVSSLQAADYAKRYQKDGVTGGHMIMLNAKDSAYYAATKKQAEEALHSYPGGMQIGGGITDENAAEFLHAGASHVIVTSYVFQNGRICEDRLEKLVRSIGREHLVLDLSCRYKQDAYYIVTDRWQKFTDWKVNLDTLESLERYCDEFLIHAVDVEGKGNGIEVPLIQMLGAYDGKAITYAGGIHSYEAIDTIYEASAGKMDYTVGSALDLFGGNLSYEKLLQYPEQKR